MNNPSQEHWIDKWLSRGANASHILRTLIPLFLALAGGAWFIQNTGSGKKPVTNNNKGPTDTTIFGSPTKTNPPGTDLADTYVAPLPVFRTLRNCTKSSNEHFPATMEHGIDKLTGNLHVVFSDKNTHVLQKRGLGVWSGTVGCQSFARDLCLSDQMQIRATNGDSLSEFELNINLTDSNNTISYDAYYDVFCEGN